MGIPISAEVPEHQIIQKLGGRSSGSSDISNSESTLGAFLQAWIDPVYAKHSRPGFLSLGEYVYGAYIYASPNVSLHLLYKHGPEANDRNTRPHMHVCVCVCLCVCVYVCMYACM